MRATFTTSFIYDGSEGYQERKSKMVDELTSSESYHPEQPNGGSMIGQIFGVTSGLGTSEFDIREEIEAHVLELETITIVPFKIAWLFESGVILIKEISPRENK